MKEKYHAKLYIENTIHDGSEGVERCRALILDKWSCRGAIERCPQQSDLNGSRSYQASIEQTETFSMNREAAEEILRQVLKNFDGSKMR